MGLVISKDVRPGAYTVDRHRIIQVMKVEPRKSRWGSRFIRIHWKDLSKKTYHSRAFPHSYIHYLNTKDEVVEFLQQVRNKDYSTMDGDGFKFARFFQVGDYVLWGGMIRQVINVEVGSIPTLKDMRVAYRRFGNEPIMPDMCEHMEQMNQINYVIPKQELREFIGASKAS